MRRHLWTLVMGGLIGTLVLASDAQAWHHKKACPPPTPCAAPAPAPQCPPPAECPPKKCCHGGLFSKHSLFCGHKEPKCEPQPCVVQPLPPPAPPCPPVVYFPPAPSSQSQWVAPTGQAPSKQGY
jgi:hypothetical protein